MKLKMISLVAAVYLLAGCTQYKKLTDPTHDGPSSIVVLGVLSGTGVVTFTPPLDSSEELVGVSVYQNNRWARLPDSGVTFTFDKTAGVLTISGYTSTETDARGNNFSLGYTSPYPIATHTIQ